MKVIYSPRAARDLETIADHYSAVASPKVVAAIGARIEHVINRLVEHPYSAPAVVKRRGVRALLVVRYPIQDFLSNPR